MTGSQKPPLEVETTVSSVVTPKLTEWQTDLTDGIGRVLRHADTEAVHDLRVALRRIRSLLQLVRPIYGRFHVKSIRDEMRKVAQATGSLRDEEVLGETFDELKLEAPIKDDFEAWRAQRVLRERTLRAAVVRQLQTGALERASDHLRALLLLPCDPKKDKEVHRFARQVVLGAQAEVDLRRGAPVEDVAAMHELRIAYKRLRYAVEAFAPALPPELRAWGPLAAKFQKQLGELHDHDVALQVLRRSNTLAADTREAVIEQLIRNRLVLAQQYLDLQGPGLTPSASPPPAKDSGPPKTSA